MSDLDAFLRWNSGHLLENRSRGADAEWLVHRALGLDPGEHRKALRPSSPRPPRTITTPGFPR